MAYPYIKCQPSAVSSEFSPSAGKRPALSGEFTASLLLASADTAMAVASVTIGDETNAEGSNQS
jgi:hypothetical protein